MKKGIHPKYQQVLFVDSSTGYKFVCGSTLQPKETEEYEGKEYPVYRLPVSSASHPFFTGGSQRFVAEGRVDKFMKRYGKKGSSKKEEKGQDSKDEGSSKEEK
ncbi:MAG: type B 50S ribosomal protein L31 [Chlamydiales bacterium]|nr:type B 50S ribosomal protein L31 [Chlamydiales bacterium]